MLRKILSLCFCALIAVSACGCARSSKTSNDSGAEATDSIGKDIKIECSDDEWVSENGDEGFSTPFINAECEDAYDMNRDIEKAAESYKNTAGNQKIIGTKYSFSVYNALLSVVYSARRADGKNIYKAYNLDLSNGKKATAEAVAEYVGKSKSEYQKFIKELCTFAFNYNFGSFEGKVPVYSEMLEKTMGDENLQRAVPIVEKSGELGAIVTLYSLNGEVIQEKVAFKNGEAVVE